MIWSARYSTILTGTQAQAINYIPRTDADNVLVIDKSGSMGNFSKMDSAKQAGRLYVDSWRTGDKIAVESFNGTPSRRSDAAQLDGYTRRRIALASI